MTSFDILIVVCVVLVLLLIGSGSAAVYYYLKDTKQTTCAVCPPPAVVDCAVSCNTTTPDCSKVTCTNMVVTQDECTTQFPCPTPVVAGASVAGAATSADCSKCTSSDIDCKTVCGQNCNQGDICASNIVKNPYVQAAMASQMQIPAQRTFTNFNTAEFAPFTPTIGGNCTADIGDDSGGCNDQCPAAASGKGRCYYPTLGGCADCAEMSNL
jgi:hypothetical protein